MAFDLTLATVPPLKLAHEFASGASEGLHGTIFRNTPQVAAAADVDALFMLIFWFSVFFFVLLMALMFYWGFFKYRRRPGVPAPRSSSHNTPLEIFWTIVPSSALLVIFLLGLWGYTDRQIAHSTAIPLSVKAWKWGWGVTYPGGEESPWTLTLNPGGTQAVPVFVVPEDSEIALQMISQDVLHSFWIPDFRIKMDLFPNRYSGFSFRTPTVPAGEEYQDHWIFCAEYCGDFHSEMAAVLRVAKHGFYRDFLAQAGSGGDPIEVGKQQFAGKCATCHSIDGSARTGPSWQNLYGNERPMADGTMVLADENYIRESILEPGKRLSAGYANQMPSFQGLLSDAQLDGLIMYIKTLSDKYEAPAGVDGEEPGAGGAPAPVDEEIPADQGDDA